MIGPRIYHTGNVIYGAQAPKYHNDVADMDDALSALIRIKVEGGPASYSYKNYNQYSRFVVRILLNSDINLSYLKGFETKATSCCSQYFYALRS